MKRRVLETGAEFGKIKFMKRHLLIFTCILGFSSNLALGQDQESTDPNLIGYETLVEELSSQSTYQREYESSGDPFSEVLFHGGIAYATSYVVIEPEAGGSLNGVLRGVEFSFGIDLLSRHWIAEGAVRSFQPENLDSKTQISLREFDLKLVHQDTLSDKTSYRLGAGLTSRYLKFRSRVPSRVVKDRYTTPGALFFIGAEIFISPKISFGPDVSYRTALIDETVDRQSLDANLRLNAHF